MSTRREAVRQRLLFSLQESERSEDTTVCLYFPCYLQAALYRRARPCTSC